MPGFILDTAAAVGDIVVNCSSVSADVELTGPRQSESTGDIKGPSVKKNANWLNLSTRQFFHGRSQQVTATTVGFSKQIFNSKCKNC